MSVKMVQDRLDLYQCGSALEEDHAVREITQEIILAGLGRTDFFQKAAFQGGTSLRIFYGVRRFSEDLDFSLQKPDPSFGLKSYLAALTEELFAYGYDLETVDRSRADRAVRKAFLKDDSLGKLLHLQYRSKTGPLRKMRIKLEVDANPPAGGRFEMKFLDFPFASGVAVFDPPSLFAGKLHALLCRGYLKGRDWYDFIWYTSRRTPVNYELLTAGMNQTGAWKGKGIRTDRGWTVAQLKSKIESTDWELARKDVQEYIRREDLPSLKLWGRDFFLFQCDKLT